MNWVIIDLFCKRLEPFLGQENLEVVSDIVHTASAWVSLLFIYDRMGNKISTSQPQTSIFIHAISWRDGRFQVSLITWSESNAAAWQTPRASSNLTQHLLGSDAADPIWGVLRLTPHFPDVESCGDNSLQQQSASLQKTFLCMFGFLYPNEQACTNIISSCWWV